jgi:hypothetical protein
MIGRCHLQKPSRQTLEKEQINSLPYCSMLPLRSSLFFPSPINMQHEKAPFLFDFKIQESKSPITCWLLQVLSPFSVPFRLQQSELKETTT